MVYKPYHTTANSLINSIAEGNHRLAVRQVGVASIAIVAASQAIQMRSYLVNILFQLNSSFLIN
jgi:hypothetical protein